MGRVGVKSGGMRGLHSETQLEFDLLFKWVKLCKPKPMVGLALTHSLCRSRHVKLVFRDVGKESIKLVWKKEDYYKIR